ncbi:hypothetical protein ACFWIJ_40335 [Streptomyces sp. NPDC127079]|uniref:hypothetical protein n=1 Tax=Streptomyces sp. NPDC127079 TaxID=3347132 RepID=UPI003647CDB6
MSVQQYGDVLALCGGKAGEVLVGGLEEGHEVIADRFTVVCLGEAAVSAVGLSQSEQKAVGAKGNDPVAGGRQPVRPVVRADDVRGPVEGLGDVDLKFPMGLMPRCHVRTRASSVPDRRPRKQQGA